MLQACPPGDSSHPLDWPHRLAARNSQLLCDGFQLLLQGSDSVSRFVKSLELSAVPRVALSRVQAHRVLRSLHCALALWLPRKAWHHTWICRTSLLSMGRA